MNVHEAHLRAEATVRGGLSSKVSGGGTAGLQNSQKERRTLCGPDPTSLPLLTSAAADGKDSCPNFPGSPLILSPPRMSHLNLSIHITTSFCQAALQGQAQSPLTPSLISPVSIRAPHLPPRRPLATWPQGILSSPPAW